MSEIIKVSAKYVPTDKWFAPADCSKIISVSIDGKKVKYHMIKAFEIGEYITDEHKTIEVMYVIKQNDTKRKAITKVAGHPKKTRRTIRK